jgi:hypothetical protein
METLLICTLGPVGYFAAMLITARQWYRHYAFQSSTDDTDRKIASFLISFLWPVLLVFTGVRLVVVIAFTGVSKAIEIPNRKERHENDGKPIVKKAYNPNWRSARGYRDY